jgi:hypothetical protein
MEIGNQRLHKWFDSNNSSWLTLPRTLIYSMSDEWQLKMARLLEEYDETYDWSNYNYKTRVQTLKEDGKSIRAPEWLTNYKHLDHEFIETIKKTELEKKKKELRQEIKPFCVKTTPEQALELKKILESVGFKTFEFDENIGGIVLGERNFISTDPGRFNHYIQEELTWEELFEKYAK